jgi:hypothetical protein
LGESLIAGCAERLADLGWVAGRPEKQRRPRKKLYDPDDNDDKWQHDRFELLDLPPDMDTYEVGPSTLQAIVALFTGSGAMHCNFWQ